MRTIHWGPVFWDSLHLMALGFPNNPTREEIQAVHNLLHSMQYLLPCDECKQHFKELLIEHPIPTAELNKLSFFEYTVDLHNAVNKRLTKYTWTYDEAYDHYFHLLLDEEKIKEKMQVQYKSLEDARKITTMQKQVDDFKDLQQVYIIVIVVLVIVTLATLIIALIIFVRKRESAIQPTPQNKNLSVEG
jgi:Erv1 / Alr family